MYVWMNVCMYVMYVWMNVCMNEYMFEWMYVWMNEYMYVWMYVCMWQVRSQDFSWGGGGYVLKMNGYKLVAGSKGMLPRENFRNFERP